jgi:hypothetical protein
MNQLEKPIMVSQMPIKFSWILEELGTLVYDATSKKNVIIIKNGMHF